MSRFTFCNCPAGVNADPERHAPDCPGRSGAGKPSSMSHERFRELMGKLPAVETSTVGPSDQLRAFAGKFAGINVLRSEYLPAQTMVVSSDLFELLKSQVGKP